MVDSTFLTILLEPGEVSALWGEPEYGARRDAALGTSTVLRMTTTNRFRGALDGSLLGLGAGGAVGAVVGLVMEDDWLPLEARATIGTLFFGGLGTGVGLVAGSLMSSREVYEFAGR